MAQHLPLKIFHVRDGPHGRDLRVRRTLNFFIRKGFLREDPWPKPYYGLRLIDVLWTCEHAAPALFEVLPAACLRFPGHLLGGRPKDLREVIAALEAGATRGPSFRGFVFERIRAWVDLESGDGRVAEAWRTRVQYKIPPTLAARVRALAESSDRTASAIIVAALEAHLTR